MASQGFKSNHLDGAKLTGQLVVHHLLRSVECGNAQGGRQQREGQRGQVVGSQQLYGLEGGAHRARLAAAWHRLQQRQHRRPPRAQRLACSRNAAW